jgi:serine/threonine protein kinase/ligand-binding sensor domain-containing protein
MRVSKAVPILILFLLLFTALAAYSKSPANEEKKVNEGQSQNQEEIDPADMGRSLFRVFTDENAGFPQNIQHVIAQDKNGYLWIGTQDGAAYYNGRRWTTVNMPSRSISNIIWAITPTSDGSIWFGTDAGGVSCLKDGKWTNYNKDNSSLPHNIVFSLLETSSPDGRHTLWIATNGGGLASLENGKWTVFNSKNSGLPSDRVRCLAETRSSDGRSILWVGTNGGGVASLENGKWTVYDTKNSGLPNNDVRSLLRTTSSDGRSTLWVGTSEGGLASLESGKWTVYDTKNSGLPNNIVRSLLETRSSDGHSILWVGTFRGGLASLENGKWTVYDTKNSGLPDDSVRCLLETTSSNGSKTLWISTRRGVASMENGKWTVYDTKNSGLPDNRVRRLLETRSSDGRSTLWAGTYEGGLASLENGKWTVYDTKNSGLPNSTVYDLEEIRSSNGGKTLWISTRGGLASLENGKWTVYDTKNSGLPGDSVRCLAETRSSDGRSTLWAGTYEGGLASLENGKWTVYNTKNSGLPHDSVRSLLATTSPEGRHTLWVGTWGGGLASLEDGKWTIFNTKNSALPGNHVLSLTETRSLDGRSTLWIGTRGGLVRLENGKWTIYSDSTNPALPINAVSAVLEDKNGQLYICTYKGILRLTPPRSAAGGDLSSYQTYTFTTDDGLPGKGISTAMLDSKGFIWVGTQYGAAMFDSTKEDETRVPKNLYIERTIVNDKLYRQANQQSSDEANANLTFIGPVADSLKGESLSYKQNDITFEYVLLTYFKEKENLYRTQLIGYDKNPSEWTADNKKNYTNLGAGDYHFKVWGKDFSGVMSDPITVSFIIRPAPWHTWWAYSLYFFGFISASYGFVRFRIKKVRQQAVIEAEIREAKLKAEAAEEISRKNEELARKNQELATQNDELIRSHQRADRIFSALAEALPGTVLDGKYRLDDKIGSGGYGAVYRAIHLGIKTPVAIKVFKPVPGNDSAENLERFQQEAISTARINHPNAVSILDSGVSTEGIAYIVMELLNGCSLFKELQLKKALSAKRTAEILVPVCAALVKAHSAGIIHRDIKPENIFLHRTLEGEVVKLVDFGIAKLIYPTSSMDFNNLTASGMVVGTPVYMAPERFSAGSYDEKVDIYSLGVMLYQMLTGYLPFEQKDSNIYSLILMHAKKMPPPLRTIKDNIPEAVEAVVMKALEKDPKKRPSAGELAHDFALAAGIELSKLLHRRVGATTDENPIGKVDKAVVTAENQQNPSAHNSLVDKLIPEGRTTNPTITSNQELEK